MLIYSKELLLGVPQKFDPVTFTANGTWEVPRGIKQIMVDVVAGQGLTFNTTAVGGKGGRVQCILSVTPKTVLYLKVGKQYTTISENRNDSMIYINNDELQVLVQAGGGGSAASTDWLVVRHAVGGAGGGLTGGAAGAASPGSLIAAQGGTQSVGGDGAYTVYSGIWGVDNRANGKGKRLTGGTPYSARSRSGCGGGGYYGGGGGVDVYYLSGSDSRYDAGAMGAGGGSSYTHPDLCSEVVHTQGFQNGNGYITISMV